MQRNEAEGLLAVSKGNAPSATKAIKLKPLHFDKDSIPIKGKPQVQPEEVPLDKDRNASPRSTPKDLSMGTLRLADNQVKSFVFLLSRSTDDAFVSSTDL